MKRIAFLLALSAAVAARGGSGGPEEWNMEARRDFASRRFGIFVNWGPSACYAQGIAYQRRGGIDRDAYARVKEAFYPSAFDAKEWARLFRDSGAKYVTFVARHHDGFSLWPTKADDGFNVAESPFGRDVTGELADACRDAGLQFNLYYSHVDWHRPDYPAGAVSAKCLGEQRGDYASYKKFMLAQLAELLDAYRPGVVWLDGEWDHARSDGKGGEWKRTLDWGFDEIYDLVHSKRALVMNNNHQPIRDKEDVQGFERDLPGENATGYSGGQPVARGRPIEQCDVIQIGTWGYKVAERRFRTAQEVCAMICRAAAKDANMLMNVGPDASGRIPPEAVAALESVGAWMRGNGDAVYGTRGAGIDAGEDGASVCRAVKGGTTYVITIPKGFADFPSVERRNDADGGAAILARQRLGRRWGVKPVAPLEGGGGIDGFTPSPEPKTDKYGGWKWTSVGTPDGFFRVRKIDGRWWFVDPDGNLFFAMSVASFNPGNLKCDAQPMKERFGSRGKWAEDETAFLKSLGFNSLGSWAAPAAMRNRDESKRIPYTVIISPMAAYNRSLDSAGNESEYFAGVNRESGSSFGFPFVFDPGFEEMAERRLAEAAKYADDPWLIGYFIDNEVQFRILMLDDRLAKWPEGHLNHDSAAAWLDGRKGRTGCGDDDRKAFAVHCIDLYFGTVSRILRRHGPNHLLLGSRFHTWKTEMENPECFRVAGKHLDVISINHYLWEPDMELMRMWEEESGRPFMVTEFYAKGEDSGRPNTSGAGWVVPSQEDRGIFYQHFANRLLKSGNCVGWAWFTYRDSSANDANKGIVARDFTRYEPLARRMKDFNAAAWSLIRFHDRR